jgi:hypothetical protein
MLLSTYITPSEQASIYTPQAASSSLQLNALTEVEEQVVLTQIERNIISLDRAIKAFGDQMDDWRRVCLARRAQRSIKKEHDSSSGSGSRIGGGKEIESAGMDERPKKKRSRD